jgi:hypothetical protein
MVFPGLGCGLGHQVLAQEIAEGESDQKRREQPGTAACIPEKALQS